MKKEKRYGIMKSQINKDNIIFLLWLDPKQNVIPGWISYFFSWIKRTPKIGETVKEK